MIKPQPNETEAKGKNIRAVDHYFTGVPEQGLAYYWIEQGCWNSSSAFHCPYGRNGDLLWVRENIMFDANYDHLPPSHKDIREYSPTFYTANNHTTPKQHMSCPGRVRPNIHMPRWASRLTLEITNLRTRRLNYISEQEVAAEGVKPKEEFEKLWDLINGKGAWNQNPFVWVLEFKVHQQNVDDFIKAAEMEE
jgi:hypothetical protein